MSHFAGQSEENYLKSIFKLSLRPIKKLNNTALSNEMELNPATVLEMIRKMTKQGLVSLQEDKSIQLTDKGKKKALQIIRRHRLWEVFLVKSLGYGWHEVHELAEQLEHIESDDLVDRLEAFLEFPSNDPHGDPIPDKKGRFKLNQSFPLLSAKSNESLVVVNLVETADSFLAYLQKIGIKPGTQIIIKERNEYDQSLSVLISKKPVQLSEKVAANIRVQPA